MPVGNPNFNQNNSGEHPDGSNSPNYAAQQPEEHPWEQDPAEPWYDDGQQAPPPESWQPPVQRQPPQRPSREPQYRPTSQHLTPRPAQQPQNSRGVRMVQPTAPRRPAPPAGYRNPRLPIPPTQRQEAPVGRRGRRILIGSMVTTLLLGGVAGYDSALGNNRIKASLGWNVGENAAAKKSAVIGEAPGVPVVASKTATPTPTVTKESPTPTVTPTPKATNKAPVVPFIPAAADCVSELPDNVLIAQKIMAPVRGDNLKEMTTIFSQRYVGGAIIMPSLDKQNPASGSILAFKKGQSIGIEVATDQEGGDMSVKKSGYTPVSRIQTPKSKLQPNGYMPTAAEMAKLKPEQITAIVAENYAYLKKQGIDTSFGLVIDVANLKGTSTIGTSRVASADPKIVTEYAKARLAGAKKAGVNDVAKHWGMGSASANTDNAPAVTPPLSVLQKRDFVPYIALKSAGIEVGGMIGSEVIPGLTDGVDKKVGTADDIPVSLSRTAATDHFKKIYLSKGAVTYTDDLGAPGISNKWSVSEASVETWKAGIDEALFVITSAKSPSKKMTVAEQIDAVIAEGKAALKSGELNRNEVEASVARLMLNKSVDACGVLKTVDSGGYKELVAKLQKKSLAASPTPTVSKPASTAQPTTAKSQ